MNEEWKDIKGFERKYKISRNGEIFNKESGVCLKNTVDKCSGYLKCNLYIDGECHAFLVHRLVAIAYIPNPQNFPYVHHKDGNQQNPCADNLEWVSGATHGAKMLPEQKKKFRESYQNNLKKRKMSF